MHLGLLVHRLGLLLHEAIVKEEPEGIMKEEPQPRRSARSRTREARHRAHPAQQPEKDVECYHVVDHEARQGGSQSQR